MKTINNDHQSCIETCSRSAATCEHYAASSLKENKVGLARECTAILRAAASITTLSGIIVKPPCTASGI